MDDIACVRLMDQAIESCKAGIEAGQSPFAALIAAADGKVVCVTHNSVRADGDITAHAEINAIRQACQKLDSIDLTGNVIVSTCEPCPMCAAAIHWARLDAVIYGAGIDDATRAGFNELALSCASLFEHGRSPVQIHAGVERTRCAALFDLWRRGPDANPY